MEEVNLHTHNCNSEKRDTECTSGAEVGEREAPGPEEAMNPDLWVQTISLWKEANESIFLPQTFLWECPRNNFGDKSVIEPCS